MEGLPSSPRNNLAGNSLLPGAEVEIISKTPVGEVKDAMAKDSRAKMVASVDESFRQRYQESFDGVSNPPSQNESCLSDERLFG